MDKVWEVCQRKFDDLIDQLLYNRGIIEDIEDKKTKERFFYADFKTGLHDPFLMNNLKPAVERIAKAKENKEKIGIFSDYDADGVPAAALLCRAFKTAKIDCEVYIPNRDIGYGLSQSGIDYLKDKGCSLIVTADLGIKNFKEADYCAKIGIDLIITDHHTPDDQLPKANWVINPKIKGEKYPFKELAGCGVAYKLVQGLAKYCKEIDEKFLKWNLDLVTIATISDMVPLTGENRVIANYGLIVINKTKNLGLQKLIKISDLENKNINSYSVGFQIAPRLNAPGRMDHASKSFELLITEDEKEASELALWLNEKNETRQLAMEKAGKEAIALIEKDKLAENKIIIIAGNWSKGIIGPTASRLVDKFARPVILFSKSNEKFTGSARSVSGVDITALIGKAEKLVDRYGGHKGAAGVTVSAVNFESFKNKMIKIAKEEIPKKLLVKKIKIDAQVDLREMSKKLYEKIITFEPFGMGNSRPVFLAQKLKLAYPRFVGREEKHLSFMADDDGLKIKSICFNSPINTSELNTGIFYDIAFSLDLNEWNNNEYLNLNIVDMRKYEKENNDISL